MLTDREIGRQIMHILIGLLMVILIKIDIISPFAIFLGIIVGLLASIISKRINLPIFSQFLNYFEREEARKSFPGKGMIFFFIGILLVLKLFDRDIALASIMILTLGDSVSHLAGVKFGKIKNIFNLKGNKLLEGTLAGTLAGFFGALIFVSLPEAFLGSMVAMIAEVVQIDFNDTTLDDNMVVPLVAGTIMYLVRTFI